MSLQSYVDVQIKKVCPIIGVRFGTLEDKATWEIQFDPLATQQQMADAIIFLDGFVWDEPTQELDRKETRNAQYENDPMYKRGYRNYLASNPGATFSEYLDYLEG